MKKKGTGIEHDETAWAENQNPVYSLNVEQ